MRVSSACHLHRLAAALLAIKKLTVDIVATGERSCQSLSERMREAKPTSALVDFRKCLLCHNNIARCRDALRGFMLGGGGAGSVLVRLGEMQILNPQILKIIVMGFYEGAVALANNDSIGGCLERISLFGVEWLLLCTCLRTCLCTCLCTCLRTCLYISNGSYL